MSAAVGIVVAGGLGQLGAAIGPATLLAAGIIAVTGGIIAWLRRRSRITRMVILPPGEEIDVPAWVRSPVGPSPAATHHDLVIQRWRQLGDDAFVADGMREAIEEILKGEE